MKNIKWCLLVAALLFSFSSQAAIMIITGLYQGKNLFVQNPSLGNDKTFCAHEVYVNDVKVMDNIRAGAFEIDLSHIRLSAQVTIKITHSDACTPKVLNPQVIKPSSAFHFNSFQVDKNLFIWSTRGERTGGKYILEYYGYDRWNLIKEVAGQGSVVLNNYDTEGVLAGIQKYRLKFIEADGRVHYSQIIEARH
jgi:hypothetical protein